MKTNPILKELWKIKEDLAREGGYDIDRIFAELRAAEAKREGRVIVSNEDLRHYVEDESLRRETASIPVLKDAPPTPSGTKEPKPD
jgi:hypothetical protein